VSAVLVDFVIDALGPEHVELVHAECAIVVDTWKGAPVGLDEIVAAASDHECRNHGFGPSEGHHGQ